MAARFWCGVVAAALLLATLIATGLTVHGGWSPWNALWLAALSLLAQPVLLVMVSFVIAWVSAPGPKRPGECHYALRAIASETVQFIRAVLMLCVDAQERTPTVSTTSAAGAGRPILLIHGILCNRGVWNALEDRLTAAGYASVRAVNLEPLFANLDTQARRVEPELAALQRQCHGGAVTIVTHSMGGLVARALLRRVGAGVIGRIITIAAPHHGTAFARGLPWPALRQMAPDSAGRGA